MEIRGEQKQPTAEEIKALKIIIIDLLRHKMPNLEALLKIENASISINRRESILIWNDGEMNRDVCRIVYEDNDTEIAYSAWWKELVKDTKE